MDDLPPGVAALLRTGELPWSGVGASLRKLLLPLIEGAVLERTRSGAGERLLVRDPARFEAWARNRYPTAAGAFADGMHHRARGLVARRDTKHGSALVAQTPLLMRATAAASIKVSIAGSELAVSELTRIAGAAVVMLDDATRLGLPSQVALVENLECFLHFECLMPECPIALLSSGRPSERLLGALARSLPETARLIHLPDYDPVGLDDFIRLKAALGERVCLHVPTDLERRFQQFANPSLLRDKPRNRDLFAALSKRPFPDHESRSVFELILRHGAGLEQESLLIALP